MKTINNPSLNAKIKAMYAQKLKKEDIEDLMKQNTLEEAIMLLKSKLSILEDLPNDAKRIELEDALDNILIYDIKKIRRYLQGTNKKIFEQYIIEYKIETIKKIYKYLSINKLDLIRNNKWVENIFTDLKILYTATSTEDFKYKIPDEEIKNIFINSTSDFERENKLDKYYFESTLKMLKGKNEKLEKLLSIRIDLLNVLWTYRCKKYYGISNPNILINYFYRIDKEVIKKIEEANTIEELNQALNGTIYKNIVGNNIETDIKKYIYEKSKKAFRSELLDLSMVISYFRMLEIERENIITILEGIRYKMPKQTIENKIII